MPACLWVASERKDDFEFAKIVAEKVGFSMQPLEERTRLSQVLVDEPRSVVLWDVDHSGAESISHPFSIKVLGQVLAQYSIPQRVFALSDHSFSELSYLENRVVFGHFLLRRYRSEGLKQLYPLIANASIKTESFGLQQFFENEIPIKRIIIKDGKQKSAAVMAIGNVLEGRKIPSRLSSLVAQGTDELLMNAQAVAPNAGSVDEFVLPDDKPLILEMADNKNYFAISVTDSFGGMKRDLVQKFLQKDFQKVSYQNTNERFASGLGLYQIINSGLSLIFINKSEVKSQVVLFAPVIEKYKDFRDSFRFFSFIQK